MSEQIFLLLLSTILVLIIAAMMGFLSAVLWQLIKILREVRGIMSNIRLGSDTLAQDLGSARAHLKSFFLGQLASRFGARRRSRKAADSSETQFVDQE